MKNIKLSAFLALLLLSAFVSTAWAGQASPWEGSGTNTAPYLIKTTNDLNALATAVNEGNDFSGKYFRLANDIEFTHTTKWENAATSSENNYTAIGLRDWGEDKKYMFNGVFDGDGKTIRGIRINNSDSYQGLFGLLGAGAKVEKLRLADVVVIGSEFAGSVVGENYGGVISDCIVDSVLIKGYVSLGGIAGFNDGGALSGNLAIRVTISGDRGYGAIVGINSSGSLSNNFYTACTLNGVANATNVGIADEDAFYHDQQVFNDVTKNNGAVSIHAVTLDEGLSITTPKKPVYTDNDQNAYYKSDELCTVTVANEDDVIEQITGVTASNASVTMNIATDKKSATFTMPGESVNITAKLPSIIVGYTVNISGNLSISEEYCTVDDVKYYNPGETYTLTANTNEIIDEIAVVTASNAKVTVTIAPNKRSATLTMPSENVSITATTTEVYSLGVPDSLSITEAYATIGGVKYYRPGDELKLEYNSSKYIISGVVGVSNYTLADDKRSITFAMPSADIEKIHFDVSEVHTVSVPEGLSISDAAVVIDGVNYYETGYKVTLSTTKAYEVIKEITGVTASIASDKKSATFTMPSTDVKISATISTVWEDGAIWGDGDGSEKHPYTIASASQLDMLASYVNAGNDFADTYFEVIKDIAYTYEGTEQEDNYTAIGNYDNRFKGNFNGNGKTISGIRIYKPEALYQGLFGYLGEGAVVENVKLADVEITGKGGTGGVAGYNEGAVRNCTVEEDVKIVFLVGGNSGFGGIAGINKGTVSGCTSSATLVSLGESGSGFGGIVGYNNGTVRNNLAKNVTISVPAATTYYGTVVGNNLENFKISNNFYIACTVADAGVEITSNVGAEGQDITEDNGAVGLFKVTFGEGVSIVAPEKPTYTDNGKNYYKPGETLSLEVVFAGEKKLVTFTMPYKDVEISATISNNWGVDDGRDGTKEHPFTIASVSDLDLLALKVNFGNDFADTYFEVVKDIAYTYEGSEYENNFTAIGTENNPFKGKFNGNGKTISGIRIYKPFDDFQGLFGALAEGAEVENVKLADVEITAYRTTGGIAGYNDRGMIRNCTVERTVKIIASVLAHNPNDIWKYFGGIVGENYSGTVSGCTSSATLMASGKYNDSFGGIVGGNSGTVSGCSSSATLIASGKKNYDFGGIAGSNGGTVSGCTSSATLIASGENSLDYGGIVGNNHGTVRNNLAKNVTISVPATTTYYGAVVGSSADSKLSNNFYTASTVNGVENATNVGFGGYENDDGTTPRDNTENNGAVGISFTEPAAVRDLVYNSSSHNLVTAGETDFGSLLYSLDGKTYAADIPAATNAGDYSVYYRVDKDDENVILPQKIEVSIAPDEKKIVVTVKGHSDTVEYTGKKQSVHGYDLASSYDAYSLEFVRYKGDSTAAGTDAGKYAMGLSAADFSNVSANYSNVAFDVSDGYILIKESSSSSVASSSSEASSSSAVSSSSITLSSSAVSSSSVASSSSAVSSSSVAPGSSAASSSSSGRKTNIAAPVVADNLKVVYSEGQLMVFTQNASEVKVNVFDMMGNLATSSSGMVSSNSAMSLKMLRKGPYVVRVLAGNMSRTLRILVK